jgi:hypothetical protein
MSPGGARPSTGGTRPGTAAAASRPKTAAEAAASDDPTVLELQRIERCLEHMLGLGYGLMESARHVNLCRLTQETRVINLFDDVGSIMHQSLGWGLRRS